MINKKLAINFLRELVQIYEERHGESQANLAYFAFDFSLVADEKCLSKILESNYADDQIAFASEAILEELRSLGFLSAEPDGSYMLTLDGYKEGKKSTLSRPIYFFNENPGLSTVVAVGVLIVAIASLYIGK